MRKSKSRATTIIIIIVALLIGGGLGILVTPSNDYYTTEQEIIKYEPISELSEIRESMQDINTKLQRLIFELENLEKKLAEELEAHDKR